MSYDEDRDEQLARLEAKLKPERIRATLSFAGLYQMTHEMIKQAVVPAVRGFYLQGFDETGMIYDEDAYKRHSSLRPSGRRVTPVTWSPSSAGTSSSGSEQKRTPVAYPPTGLACVLRATA